MRWRRGTATTLVALAALAGCDADATPVGEETPVGGGSESVAGDESTDAPGGAAEDDASPLDPDDPAVRDAITLTALAEVLEGTRFEGVVDDDPGVFLELTSAVCAALDDGASGDDALSALLTTLSEAGLQLDDDTAYVGGALVGAAVGSACPDHRAEVAT